MGLPRQLRQERGAWTRESYALATPRASDCREPRCGPSAESDSKVRRKASGAPSLQTGLAHRIQMTYMSFIIYTETDMPRRKQPDDLLPLKPKPFLLLLILADEGPVHGYAIKKELARRSGGTIRMDPGGLYRLIGRLERDGLVRRAASPSTEEDERRQYLELTEWGRSVLEAEARRIAALARMPAVRKLAGGGS